jgi:hypothetical protein
LSPLTPEKKWGRILWTRKNILAIRIAPLKWKLRSVSYLRFIRAVTELFGPEEAKLSAEDWLGEAELLDSPPQTTSRKWRAVTIVASARLANRLSVVAFDPCILSAPR